MFTFDISQRKIYLKSKKRILLSAIGFSFLTLIVCVLVASFVSAEGYNVLSTDYPTNELDEKLFSSPAGDPNVLNVSSDNSGSTVNSLSADKKAGNDINKIITADVNVTNLSINLGDTILISLKEYPTTGYLWNITNSSGLEIVSDEYGMESTGNEVAGGVGGVHKWVVKPVETADQTFSAVMMRGGYKPPGKGGTYLLNIIVKENGRETILKPVEERLLDNPTAKNSVI